MLQSSKGKPMILYFTGTGNSRFVAERIATSTGDEAINISKYIKEHTRPTFTDTGVYVFVAPCYVSTTAMAMFDFINDASFPEGIRAYFVITSASYMGAAPATNGYISKKKGFLYMGTENIIMPQNYITHFKTKTNEENQKIVSDSLPDIDRISSLISSGKPFRPAKLFFGELALTNIVCAIYYKLFMSTRKFHVTDKCISCKKCVRDCPLGNISFDGSGPVWGRNCTHCMACINLCPGSAIEYGRSTQGKERYKGPSSNHQE